MGQNVNQWTAVPTAAYPSGLSVYAVAMIDDTPWIITNYTGGSISSGIAAWSYSGTAWVLGPTSNLTTGTLYCAFCAPDGTFYASDMSQYVYKMAPGGDWATVTVGAFPFSTSVFQLSGMTVDTTGKFWFIGHKYNSSTGTVTPGFIYSAPAGGPLTQAPYLNGGYRSPIAVDDVGTVFLVSEEQVGTDDVPTSYWENQVSSLPSGATSWTFGPAMPSGSGQTAGPFGLVNTGIGRITAFGSIGTTSGSAFILPTGASDWQVGDSSGLPASGGGYPLASRVGTQIITQEQSGLLVLDLVTAPFAPQLTAPPTATYADTASGVTFTAIYNSSDGSPSNARALRVKVAGGSYNYFNAATSAIQSGEVWNPVSIDDGDSQSFDVPAGVLVDGNTYNWSVADQESYANMQGPFASDFTVNASIVPTVTVTSPSGSLASAVSAVTWTATTPVGSAVISYQAKIFSETQYTAPGFDPATSAAVLDSGVLAGSATSWGWGAALLANDTYRFYVQVTETGGIASNWAYSTATLGIEPPATPTVSVALGTAGPGLPIANVTVDGFDNILIMPDSYFGDGGSYSWKTNANWSAALDSTVGLVGTKSLKLTRTDATADGSVSTWTYYTSSALAYTVLASILADSTTAGLQYKVSFSGSSQTVTLGAAGTWTQASFTAVGQPAGESQVVIDDSPQTAPASGQIIHIDKIGVFPTTDAQWSPGGFFGNSSVIVTRSDGLQARGASSANPAPLSIAPGFETATIVDAEMIPGVQYTWTAQVISALPDGGQVTSGISAPSPPAALPAGTGWWEFDPTDLSTAVHAQMTDYQVDVTEQATAHTVLGQPTANVIASVMGGVDGTATFETFDTATYKKLTDLLLSQKTVFMSDPYGDNQGVTYVRFGPQTGGMSTGNGLRAKSAQLKPSTPEFTHHTLTVTWVAQPRPAV